MKNRALIINYPSSEKDFRLPIIRKYLLNYYKVDVCFNPLWGDYKTKTKILSNPLRLVKNILKEISYLIVVFSKIYKNNYSLVIIGYPAYIEALFLKLVLPKNIKRKIYIDFFISLYDTLVLDRNRINRNAISAKFLFLVDKRLLQSFNKIFVDTQKNASRFAEMFSINIANFNVLFVGSYNLIQETIFEKKVKKGNTINIGWVGAIIPLHGLEEVIECAIIVKDKDIVFHLIGNGPCNELDKIKREIESAELTNIILYDELDFEKTMTFLNNCDICLGIFGKSDKAKSVIPFKIFDYLYLNKPIITQNSEAIMELSAFDQIYKVENNAVAIAEEIFKVDTSKSINNKVLLIKMIGEQYKKLFSYT